MAEEILRGVWCRKENIKWEEVYIKGDKDKEQRWERREREREDREYSLAESHDRLKQIRTVLCCVWLSSFYRKKGSGELFSRCSWICIFRVRICMWLLSRSTATVLRQIKIPESFFLSLYNLQLGIAVSIFCSFWFNGWFGLGSFFWLLFFFLVVLFLVLVLSCFFFVVVGFFLTGVGVGMVFAF